MVEHRQDEHELIGTWFDALASSATIGSFRTDFDRGVVWVDDRFVEFTGRTRAQLFARGDWIAGAHPDDIPRLRELAARARRTHEPVTAVFRITEPDGDERWVRVRAAPVGGDGSITGYAGVLEDLSDSVGHVDEARLAAVCAPTSDPAAALALQASRSEAQFRMLAEASPFGIVEVDEDGEISFVNERYCELFGYGREEVRERLASSEIIHPDDRDTTLSRLLDAFAERRPLEIVEHRLVRADGTVVWARAHMTPIVDDDGRFHGYVATVEDVSDEIAERADIDRLLQMLDATPDYATITDARGRVLFMNPAARELFGIDAHDPLDALDYRSCASPRSVEVFEGEVAAVLEERGMWSGELALLASDGREVPVHLTAVASRGDDGTRWYASVSRDISELKEAQQRLAHSAAWFRSLLGYLTDLVIVEAHDGRTVYVSPSVEALLGYRPEDVLSTPGDLPVVHPDDRDAVRAAHRAARSEPGRTETVEYRIRHRDGSWRWFAVSVHNLLEDLAVQGVVINAKDVTEARRAREAQARSEAALQAIVGQSPLAIYAVDRDGFVRLWNRAAEELFGYSVDEVTGTALPMAGREGTSVFGEVRDRVLSGETVRDVEVESQRSDGTPIVVSLSAAPIRGADGEIVTVLGVLADVTDRRAAEVALRRSEERFRAIATHGTDLIGVVDREGRLTYVSPSVRVFIGDREPSPFEHLERVHPDDRGSFAEAMDRVLEHGGSEGPFEGRFRDVDGNWRCLEIIVTNLLDDPAVEGLVLNAHDVTERVEAAATLEAANDALRRSNESFRAVFDNSPVAMYTFDEGGHIRTWNPACEEIFGFREDEVVGRFSPVLRDTDAEAIAALRRRVMAGEIIRPTEARRRHKDGREIDVVVAAAPMRGPDGEVESVLVLASDITSEKQHHRALLENEARFRALAEHASVMITILEADGTTRYASPSTGRILGHPHGYGQGVHVFSYIHPDDRDGAWQLFQRVLADPEATEVARLRVQNSDGQWRDIEAVANNLLDDPAVQGVVIIARDVTEQVAAEQMARASQERFQALVQNLSDIITIVDDDGSVTWASPAIERVLGYRVDEITGTRLDDQIHPDDLGEVLEVIAHQRERAGPHEPFTFRMRHADGSWRYIESMLDDLRDNSAIGSLVFTSRDATDAVESEARLAESEARYRGIVEDQTELLCRYEPDGTLSFVNEAYARYFGRCPREIVGTRHLPFIPEEDHERLREALRELSPANPAITIEHRILRPDGAIRWHEWTHRLVLDDHGHVREIGAVGRDITEQREAEALVADQARVLEMVARGAPLPETLEELCKIVETHAPDIVCAVMLVDEGTSGHLRCGAAPSLPRSFLHDLDGLPVGPRSGSCGTAAHLGEPVAVNDVETDPLWSEHRQLPLAHGLRAAWSHPITAASSDRVVGTVCLYSHQPQGPSAHHERLLAMVVRHAAIAIERKQFEAQLAHQAHHDPLTDLPNRTLFLEFLVLALARARRYRSTVAVLFLDLDRFKVINDSLGHEIGDDVLAALAERLRSVLRPGDTVARFGGDEFTVLCEDLSGPQAKEQAAEVAERLLDVIHQPFLLEGEEHFVSASVGIALAATGDDGPDALLRDADAAMYRAKERGKGRWELFDDSMRQNALRRLEIENALHRAIDRGEFRVFYQPCMSVPDRRCVGGEALVRWQHPERGLVAPLEFIGLAEETGLVIPLGRWVLEEACRQAARWHAERTDPGFFQISVNLSGRQLGHPDLVEQVASTLERTGVAPELICLEITESVLMEDVDATIATLGRLKELGVWLAIDDFGTGYSSLGYLKRFPVDFVKVDRSFVAGLGTNSQDSAIVAAVVSLGHALDVRVVAEGVETELQLAELEALGCDQAQGFLFAPPQPASDVHAAMTHSHDEIGGILRAYSQHSPRS